MTDTPMPASLTIRPMTAGDRPDWHELWQAYLAFYKTELPEEVYETSFARLLDPSCADLNGLLAVQGGQAVGLVHYIFHRHMWRADDVCYLQDLFVAPDTRGGGVGRALIQAVYERADAAGAPSVYWLTQADNAQARVLYDQVADVTPFIKYQRKVA